MVINNEEALSVALLHDLRYLHESQGHDPKVIWRAALQAALAFQKQTDDT